MNEEENNEKKDEKKKSLFDLTKGSGNVKVGQYETPVDLALAIYQKIKKPKEKKEEKIEEKPKNEEENKIQLSQAIANMKVKGEFDYGPPVFKCKYLNCPFWSFTKEELRAHYYHVHKEIKNKRKREKYINNL